MLLHVIALICIVTKIHNQDYNKCYYQSHLMLLHIILRLISCDLCYIQLHSYGYGYGYVASLTYRHTGVSYYMSLLTKLPLHKARFIPDVITLHTWLNCEILLNANYEFVITFHDVQISYNLMQMSGWFCSSVLLLVMIGSLVGMLLSSYWNKNDDDNLGCLEYVFDECYMSGS